VGAMILSKTCDYGLRAALYVATRSDREYVSIGEISKKLNISFHFLTKILQILTEKNLMISYRGPKGGVKLTRPADTITLLDIIIAIEGADFFEKCLLGLEKCKEDNPCPLHQNWAPLRRQLKNLFQKNTLGEIAGMLKTNQFRITNLMVKF
jgi:Rrf2 family iron-sulfur cluster assembly transcriptional regulator